MGFFSEQALWLGYHWSTGAIVVEYPSQGVIELLPDATNDANGSETHTPFTTSRKHYPLSHKSCHSMTYGSELNRCIMFDNTIAVPLTG